MSLVDYVAARRLPDVAYHASYPGNRAAIRRRGLIAQDRPTYLHYGWNDRGEDLIGVLPRKRRRCVYVARTAVDVRSLFTIPHDLWLVELDDLRAEWFVDESTLVDAWGILHDIPPSRVHLVSACDQERPDGWLQTASGHVAVMKSW